MTLPKKHKRYLFRKSLATILLSILVVALVVAGFALNMLKGYIDERPSLEISKLETPESSLVYDSDGNLFAEIGLKLSDNVTYNELPTVVIDAFVAIEDAKFFGHEGFDLARFTNEAVQTAVRFLRGGGYGAGASTITMQIIKNSFFSDDENLADESIERKAQEISMAMDLEKLITKEQIMEYYLNKINFGVPNSRGISKAAQYYFNKSVSELNLSEAAYLAGVINEPGNLNAYTNIENATFRRNTVLDLMARHGYITPEENELAKKVKLENQLWGADKYYGDTQPFQEYLDAVIEEVTTLYNLDPYHQGLKIYTGLNRSQQTLIEDIEKNAYGGFYDDYIDGAFVSINNQTGLIIALGGGRKFEGQEQVLRGFNNAISLKRQPGSVLKPILPYALSFEYLGYSNKHVIEDGPYAYLGSPVFVNNYSGYFQGDITMEDAVIQSLNIPALKTMDAVLGAEGAGYERVTQYLNNLGFDENVAATVNSAYSIGGGLFEATPLQIASAHATMINLGEHIQPHTITRIEVNGREPIVVNFEPVQAISAEAAYITTDLLRAVVEAPAGTGTIAWNNRKWYPVYAKTGTSDHDDSYVQYGIPDGITKDSWLAASTSEYTHVVWQGYKKFVDDDGVGHYIDNAVISSELVSNQMNLLLDNAANFHEPVAVERPAGVVNIRQVLGVFPYVAPVEGMDSDYVTNSLIIDKFSRLGRLEAAQLANLTNQKVTVGDFTSEGLKINIEVDQYPQEGSTQIAPKTKTMRATNSLGETIFAQGRRLFDPSWMFGSVQYGTEVTYNGSVIKSEFSSEPNRELVLNNIRSNSSLQVCSFYTWDKNHDTRSNSICETVNSGFQKVKVPDFVGSTLAEAQQWISANTNAGITVKTTMPTSMDQLGTIASINPNYGDQEISKDTLDRANFTITVYDGEINNLQSYVGRNVRNVVNDLGRYFSLVGPTSDPNAKIQTITVNGQAVNTVPLSSGATITFTIVQPEPTPEPTPTPTPTPEPTPTPDPTPQP